MPKFGKVRLRRRQVRQAVWIAITAFSALAMIIGTVAPYLGKR